MTPPSSRANVINQLTALFGDRVATAHDVRAAHGRDPSHHTPAAPDVVVYPHTTDDVVQIVKLCAAQQCPVIPYGCGTSLEGHIAAVRGGVCVDLSQMNRIIEVHADDLDCRVEAGVTHKQLNAAIEGTGLFFPIGPGVECSIGGMTATGASGTNAVRYGTMRDGVLGLTVVLADGRVMHTGGRARKSSAGYDLTHLFVGSEGTLGIITEVQLRLFAKPPATVAAVCAFASLDDAVRAVIDTVQHAIPIARIELLDELQIDAVNRYSSMDHTLAPTLFFEFRGTDHAVKEQVQQVQAIAAQRSGGAFHWAREPEQRAALWQARHDAYYAALALRPGCVGWTTDVCVPISQLARCIAETKQDIVQSGLTAPIVGHVGDGNFHLVYVFDPEDSDERARVEAHNDRLIRRALEMDGSCTGEHGVGLGKMKYLPIQHGEQAVDVMRAIKYAFDPLGIMNPGKVVDMSRQDHLGQSADAFAR